MKYIIITEFGDVFKANEITEQDLRASDDGILTIIDITTKCTHVLDTKWEAIKEYPTV